MPLFYLRRLTGSQRTENANRHLARYLAFIAGAANAGGLLAVGSTRRTCRASSRRWRTTLRWEVFGWS
jgi:hypothetical protein